MVAVPELSAAPVAPDATDPIAVPVRRRRAVAVATSAMELLRPESDLARLLESFQEVDLLLAADDRPVRAPACVHVLGGDGPVPVDDRDDDDRDDDGGDERDDDEETGSDAADDVRARASALVPVDLQVHRLGLTPPLGPAAEADLVAAMSELVGFDPEPGVYCLAPAASPSDAAGGAVGRAAQRIARVYGIPLLRYRCHELTVVED